MLEPYDGSGKKVNEVRTYDVLLATGGWIRAWDVRMPDPVFCRDFGYDGLIIVLFAWPLEILII